METTHHMEKQAKLVQKVKRLLRRAGLPRWLHRFGPKKYELWHHVLALLLRQECRLGYRRITRLLRNLGFSVPCPSALCMSAKRIPLALWQLILSATASAAHLVAIDGSGMSRTLPSPYYYKRIDKPYPVEIPLKLSILIDTRSKKILALRLRAKRAHDIKDAKYLLNRAIRPSKLVADKAYDAEWLHRFCASLNIKAIIPMRDYGTKKIYRGKSFRKYAQKNFRTRTYNRRAMIESVFSAIKRKFGASISSTTISAQRAEMYCRAIAHNIFVAFIDFLNAA